MMGPLRIALLLFCLGTLPTHADEMDWAEQRVEDLGVPMPTGHGWRLEDAGEGGLETTRLARTPSGKSTLAQRVAVYPHVLPEIFFDWLPVEVATDYLLWEIQNMQELGVETGEFTFDELDVYEEQHGDFALHVLRNVKSFDESRYPLFRQAQELYLVFLPDFGETTTFYKIFISSICIYEECLPSDLDLSAMLPLLDGLKDYSPDGE